MYTTLVKKSRQNDKQIELIVMRSILTVLVVIGHASFYQIETRYGGVHYENQLLALGINDSFFHKCELLLTNFIYGFHMQAFFVLSGILFGKQILKNKWGNLYDLVIDKFKRLILPMLFVYFIWNIPIKLICNFYYDENARVKNIFLHLIDPDCMYLWFLESLFTSFIIVFWVNKYINHKMFQGMVLILLWCLGIYIKMQGYHPLGDPFVYALWLWIGILFEKLFIYIRNVASSIWIIIYVLFWGMNRFAIHINFLYNAIIPLLGVIMIYSVSCSIAYKCYKKKLSCVFGELNEYSFGIYLWAEPINYLFLFVLVDFGSISVLGSNVGAGIFYVIRIVMSVMMSITITYFLKRIEFRIKVY